MAENKWVTGGIELWAPTETTGRLVGHSRGGLTHDTSNGGVGVPPETKLEVSSTIVKKRLRKR